MHPTWEARYDELLGERRRGSQRHYRRLDAAQLLKHYLGLKQKFDCEVTLLYLYWEPEDAEGIDVCSRHRSEVDQFGDELADDQIAFAAQRYPDLWGKWLRSDVSWLTGLASTLRARYLLPIEPVSSP